MFTRLLHVALPARCAGCQRTGSWWCRECAAQTVPIRSPICAGCRRLSPDGRFCPNCRRRTNLTGLIAAAHATDPLPRAIKALKYRHARSLVEPLAALAADAVARHPLSERFTLVPVPLHPSRERQRGHNQAALLSNALSTRCSLPVANGLFRLRATPSQTALSRAARRANMAGAFAWPVSPLRGRIPLLVDDVYTTGATLDAAARAMRQAGCRQVWGLVVALR